MGDEDRGCPGRPQRGAHLLADVGAQPGVEGREGLVEQHQRRLRGQRAGQRDALLLPAGELGRHPAAVPGEADELEHLLDAAPAARGAGESEAHVGGHAQVPEQGAFLRHQPDAAALGRHVDALPRDELPVEPHGARVDRVEAGDHPQQRRLAAAGAAEHGGQRAGRDLQVHTVEDRHPGVARMHAQDRQRVHGELPRRSTRSSSSVGTAATSTSTTA